MLPNVRGGLIVGFVAALTIAVGAQQWSKPIEISPMPGGQVTPSSLGRAPLVPPSSPKTPTLIKAIAVPSFISSIDIMFVDQIRGRLYIADRSNCGIDVIDAVADTFITRIASPSFVCSPVGGTANAGPNGVLVTPDNKLWFGDSNNTLQIIDLNAVTVNSSQQVTTLTASQVTTKSALANASHANSTRADELAYDPFNRVIAMANDGTSPPEVSFFNADTFAIRGSIQFPDANGAGLEQPIWSTRLHAFVINVPGPNEYLLELPPSIYDTAGTQSTNTTLSRFPITDCAAATNGGVNGLAYAPSLNLFAASGCANGYLVNGDTGAVTKLASVIGGDEVWYNEGDGQFYYVGLGAGNGFLSTVNATTGTLVSQSFPNPSTLTARMRNVAAYEGNNQIFSVSTRLAAPAADTTPCFAQFNLPANSGCVLVWAH
jgi:hypothetical protein